MPGPDPGKVVLAPDSLDRGLGDVELAGDAVVALALALPSDHLVDELLVTRERRAPGLWSVPPRPGPQVR